MLVTMIALAASSISYGVTLQSFQTPEGSLGRAALALCVTEIAKVDTCNRSALLHVVSASSGTGMAKVQAALLAQQEDHIITPGIVAVGGDRRLHALRKILVSIEPCDGGVLCSIAEFEIFEFGADRASAISRLHESLVWHWDEYADCSDESMDEGARYLASQLRSALHLVAEHEPNVG